MYTTDTSIYLSRGLNGGAFNANLTSCLTGFARNNFESPGTDLLGQDLSSATKSKHVVLCMHIDGDMHRRVACAL